MVNLSDYVASIRDFPTKGILFRDITPILQDPEAFRTATKMLAEYGRKVGADVIVGPEARGFVFGSALAYKMGLGFVMARKAGKLPGKTYEVEYALEYGTAKLQIPANSFRPGQRVLMIDDLLATGGSLRALEDLIVKAGGLPVAALTLINLVEIEGWKNLGVPQECLIELSALHA